MEGQLSIFDFMGEFANLPEEKMVDQVGQRLGIKFKPEVLPKGVRKYKPEYEYEYKRKGLKLTVGFSTDWKCKTFISAGYDTKLGGGGGPFYSIDDAVNYFKKILEKYDG